MTNLRTFGNKGELYAKKILVKKGYKVIDQNVYTPFGELDLVAIKDNTLVFIEVKTRRSTQFGQPEEAVTPRKLSHIQSSGQYFALKHPKLPKKMRIEVISIIMSEGGVNAKLIQVY